MLKFGSHARHLMRQLAEATLAHAPLRPPERLDEPLVRIWLEHVIGRSQIERIYAP